MGTFRLGALVVTAGLLAVGISGCVGGNAAPQCSAEISESFQESISVSGAATSEFPAPELLSGGGVYCWAAVESGGTVLGFALFEGANGDEVAIDRLEANGFTQSEQLPSSYERDELIADVQPSNGEVPADSGAPTELVGKEIAILFVGTQP